MSGPNGEPDMSADGSIIEDEDDFDDEEYTAVNSMLDQINSYLDDLEEKNDSLNGKLHELLESNRQARLEFRAQRDETPVPDSSSTEESETQEPLSNVKDKD
ncbi:unnamed protein product [Knipowitschia caucasica]|uniref:Bublin coiled-coil protein n=1 Tax=Knipowitschia caucasica TaxID=637954 RepID=A0AAV2IYX0_KNICA